MSPAAEALRAWHDFYMLTGTAAATLIGAMFVVVSIGSRFLTADRLPQISGFMSATVVHLTVVVLTSALVMVPLEWRGFGIILGIGGIAGLAYGGVRGRRVWQSRVDWTDPLWYGLLPLCGYLAMLTADVLMLLNDAAAFEVLAIAPLLLLVAGVRNAWDMILHFALRDDGTQ